MDRSKMEIGEKLVEWFEGNDRGLFWREDDLSSLQFLALEILLQRTRAETVDDKARDFILSIEDPEDLLERDLREDLKPLGFWRKRAKVLRRVATYVQEEGIPQKREELTAIDGVGEYIADAFLFFSEGRGTYPVDVNVRRVLGRALGIEGGYKEKMREMDDRRVVYAILDLGALVCKSKPLCGECPISGCCEHIKEGGGTLYKVVMLPYVVRQDG